MNRIASVVLLVAGVAIGLITTQVWLRSAPETPKEKVVSPEESAKDIQIGEADELARVKSENDVLKEQLTEVQEKLAALNVSAETEAEEKADEPATGTEEDDEEPPTLDEIRENIHGSVQARTQLQALTEMAYADFFNSLELEPAEKDALRELLTEGQIEQIALMQYAIRQGDVTGRQYGQWDQQERDRLAGEVEKLLSKEDYEAWEEYAATIDERALETQLGSQIGMFSSGLTPENHTMVMDVAVEEFMAEQNATRESDEIYTAQEPYLYQIRAMDAMRERLQSAMPEDQYRELENWLRMGDNMLRQSMPPAEEDEDGVQ